MIPEAGEARLRRKDRKVLEARCRSPMTLQRDLKRARIVLLAAASNVLLDAQSKGANGCQPLRSRCVGADSSSLRTQRTLSAIDADAIGSPRIGV
jgi:hypothetical protein